MRRLGPERATWTAGRGAPGAYGRQARRAALALAAVAFASTALWASSPLARADDWPQAGLEPGRTAAPDERLAPGVDVAWQADLGAPHVAGLVAADGVLVVAGEAGLVRGLAADDGRELWRRDLGPGPLVATPAAARGRVVVARADGPLACLALETGALLWEVALEGSPAGALATDGALALASLGAPAVEVVALDLASGAVRWRAELPAVAHGPPALAGGLALVTTTDGALHALDRATGAPLGRLDAGGARLLGGVAAAGAAGPLVLPPGGADARVHLLPADPGAWGAGARTLALADPGALPGVAGASTLVRVGPRVAASTPCVAAGLAALVVRFDWGVEDVPAGGRATWDVTRWVSREHVVVVDLAAGAVAWRAPLATAQVARAGDVPPFGRCPAPVRLEGGAEASLALASSLVARVSFRRLHDGADAGGFALGPPASGAPARWAPASDPIAANARLHALAADGRLVALALGGNAAPLAPAVPPVRLDDAAGALRWTAHDPDGAPGGLAFEVRLDRDGEVLLDAEHAATTPAGATSWPLPPLAPEQPYAARVRARDAAGAWSPWSVVAPVVAAPTPEPVRGLRAAADVDRVELAWEASPSPQVARHLVRHRALPDGPWSAPADVGPALATTVTGLAPGLRHAFEVVARSGLGRDAPPARVEAVTEPRVTIEGAPFASLRDALAAARPGQVVRLAAGTFRIVDGPLVLPHGVQLRGASAHTTRLEGRRAPGADLVVVRGPPAGAAQAGATSRVERVSLHGAARGLVAERGAEVELRHAVVYACDDGLVAGPGARVDARFVTITDAGRGAVVEPGGALALSHALVTGNEAGLVRLGGDLTTAWSAVAENRARDRDGCVPGPNDLALAPAFRDRDARDHRIVDGSASVDRGDPALPVELEPAPHGGRVNLGAFGATEDAARSQGAVVAASRGPAPAGHARSGGGCALAPRRSASAAAPWLLALVVAVALARQRRGRAGAAP